MDHIAGMCRDVAEIREPFVARHDLPPAHAAKLHVWVSDSLREQLVDRFQFEPSILEAAISEAFLETMAEAPPTRAPTPDNNRRLPVRRNSSKRATLCSAF